MSDIDIIREALLLPKTIFPDALAALDRIEKAQHTAHTHSVSDRERRYETALEAIQELCGHMPDNRATASVARIARIALREEA